VNGTGREPLKVEPSDPRSPETTIVETITSEVVVESVVESLVVDTLAAQVLTDTTIVSALDDDVLEAALLTAEDLNGIAEFDVLGEWDEAQVEIHVVEEDDHADEGLCPGGEPFVLAATEVTAHFATLDESIMSFSNPTSADSWVAAYGSCLGQEWVEDGDPDEYVTVEPLDIIDLGDESTGFLVLSAHATSAGPEHGDGVALVQVSPTLLVALKLWGDDPPPDPYDPSILNGLTAVAVAKAAAVLG
jgi:hypothetical protein